MNLAVIKHPSALQVSICRELADVDNTINDGEVIMSRDEYEAWLQMPEQIKKFHDISAAIKANSDAASAANKTMKIQDMADKTGLSLAACEYILKEQGVIV